MDQQQPPSPGPTEAPPPPAVAPPAPAVVPPPAVPPVTVAPPPTSAPPYWQGGAEPAGPAPGVEFAGYGARLLAYILDAALLGIVITVLSFVLVPVLAGTTSDGQLSGAGAAALTVWIGVIVLVSLLYFPFFWQRNGQTPGMQALHVRVVRDRDGGPLGWGGAILRYIGYGINSIVFGLPIGWLWILFDSRRRGWHDLIGGTVVIKA
jgi:uncharacterized RDD family membrane protein YckC